MTLAGQVVAGSRADRVSLLYGAMAGAGWGLAAAVAYGVFLGLALSGGDPDYGFVVFWVASFVGAFVGGPLGALLGLAIAAVLRAGPPSSVVRSAALAAGISLACTAAFVIVVIWMSPASGLRYAVAAAVAGAAGAAAHGTTIHRRLTAAE